MSTNPSHDEHYPIAVLIEELRNEDVQFRLNSIRKLETIAIALGPKKTREQLIPFLTESVYDEDDVLVALTEQLIKLIPHIGGPKQVRVLLPLLETLGTVEETVVRDKAVQVLRRIACYFNQEDMQECYYPLVLRFATAQWFATKISAAGLLSVVYPRVENEYRQRILDLLIDLARDELATVRTAVASKIGELAAVMLGQAKMEMPDKSIMEDDDVLFFEEENVDPGIDAQFQNGYPTVESFPPLDPEMERQRVLNKLMLIVMTLAADEQDTIRYMNFESAMTIARCLAVTAEDPANYEPDRGLVQVVQQAATDKSWRVRCALANKFPLIFEAFGRKMVREDFYILFINLLSDNESEVRVIGVNRARAFAYLLVGLPVPVDAMALCNNGNSATDDQQQPWNDQSMDKFGSAASAITTASSLLSSGENTLGAQLQAQVQATTNGTSQVCQQLVVASADTDNFIFRFHLLSNSLKSYRETLLQRKKSLQSHFTMEGGDAEMQQAAMQDDQIILLHLIPALKELQIDPNPHVRVMLANTIMHLVPLLGKEATVEQLLPIIVTQLKDESQEVRLNLIVRFDYLNEVIGQEAFTRTLMPLITQLANDRKWRVRLGIMDYLLLLAEKFGQQFFTESMILLCLSWLIDHSYAIRLAAVINITKLSAIFGEEWTRDKLVPNILELATDENYLHRMICIQTLMSLSEILPDDVTRDRLLPCALRMATDKVPNVRFKVAQSLANLAKMTEMHDQVKPILAQLSNDEDADVRYYAHETADILQISLA